MIDADLADQGIDVWDRGLLRARPWTWLEQRILALLTRPVDYAPSGVPIYRTRLASHFYQQTAFDAAQAQREHQQRR